MNLTGGVGELASYTGGGHTYVFFCAKGTNVIAQLYTVNGDGSVKSNNNLMPIGKEGKMIAFTIERR